MRVCGIFIVLIICFFQFGSTYQSEKTLLLAKSAIKINEEIIPAIQKANREAVNILSNSQFPNGSIDALKELQQLPILGSNIADAIYEVAKAFALDLPNQGDMNEHKFVEIGGLIFDTILTPNAESIKTVFQTFLKRANSSSSVPNLSSKECASIKQYVKNCIHDMNGVYTILKSIIDEQKDNEDYNLLNNAGSEELVPEMILNTIFTLWTQVAYGAMKAFIQISQSTNVFCDSNIDWNWKLSNFNDILKNAEQNSNNLVFALKLGEHIFSGIAEPVVGVTHPPTTQAAAMVTWTDPPCC